MTTPTASTTPSVPKRRHALALLGSGLALATISRSWAADAAAASSAATIAWPAITKEARGQTVYFNAWAGSEQINAYLQWAANEVQRRIQYRTLLRRELAIDHAGRATQLLVETDEGGKVSIRSGLGESGVRDNRVS